jgi:hypothetical protein
MGSVKDNGGKREGAGRKPKADEDKLIQRLSKFDDIAEKCMIDGIKAGEYNFWNKFMEFRYGKPKERMDVTTNGDNLNIPNINFFGRDKDK